MDPEFLKSVYELTGDNQGAIFAIAQSNSTDVNSKLLKLNIKGEYIWCMYCHMCDKDVDKFVAYVLQLTERPEGIFKCGHDWGSSYKSARTVCFSDECCNEGTSFCTGCFATRYCSRKCQRNAWKLVHKDKCKTYYNNIMTAICGLNANAAEQRLYKSGIISKRGAALFIKKYITQ